MNPQGHQGPLISTSALAKQLDLPARRVFELLVDKGWIERIDKHWKLTGKGQFEGGDYVNSKKYGEFIGWPESVLEHGIFTELFDRPLRTRVIGRDLDISAHRFNALLAELGWQQRHHRGWILTAAGRDRGGKESEDEESGVPYTLWPRTILEDAELAAVLDALQQPLQAIARSQQSFREAGHQAANAKNAAADDGNDAKIDAGDTEGEDKQPELLQLDFGSQEQDEQQQPQNATPLVAMDGHRLDHPEDAALDNWFYLMGVAHAYHRNLAEATLGCCDFYLPAAHLHVECWHAADTGAALKAKMARLAYYKSESLPYFELSADQLLQLDSVLPKTLLKHGITVF
ncbi:MAG: phage antirepressor KilAC domain-containing protein [Gammaproteobacteria bacterium]|nr:phage antirepressor KilAC domain-containing protein [Gammaproteobacteria bacterium]RZV59210.1 MAG: hypothetical protein EX270_01785 [Pseudomonadales bacterium]